MSIHRDPDGGAAPASDPDGGAEARARDRVVAYWDLSSPTYDASPGHATRSAAERRAWLEALGALLPPVPADALDVGTGTGFLALLLAELGHRVTGVDLAPGMLAAAREKAARLPPGVARPRFEPGDAVDPPLPAGSVDAVVSRHLLWTLTDPAAAFASWRRLLRPGGRVVVVDGLWRLGRSPAPPPPAAPDAPDAPPAAAAEPERAVWARHYTADVQRALPLYDAPSVDAAVAAARAAGFRAVRVAALEAVDQAENAAHPDRPPRTPRYVLTGERA